MWGSWVVATSQRSLHVEKHGNSVQDSEFDSFWGPEKSLYLKSRSLFTRPPARPSGDRAMRNLCSYAGALSKIWAFWQEISESYATDSIMMYILCFGSIVTIKTQSKPPTPRNLQSIASNSARARRNLKKQNPCFLVQKTRKPENYPEPPFNWWTSEHYFSGFV